MIDTNLSALHKQSLRNRKHQSTAHQCGCFFCLSIFDASRVTQFWDDETTAVCPLCGIDSVIYDSQVESLTPGLLQALKRYAWNDLIDADTTDVRVVYQSVDVS
ncbi:hypothetical protein [Pseudomaricurvus sp. HS19]|uniref:hypothetical protein n=1 Tax=Pseudomaricurvus sp. HS19 TaxID=2692626 RepID=UPI0019290C75|nr:hypothetical protein [Pseudomaricurvus sp. HS19]